MYGPSSADSTDFENMRELKFHFTKSTEDFVVTHIPGVDVLHSDMSLGETIGFLRHLLVADHEQKSIVLSLRGTASFTTAIADVLAFSEEFCGGQAHSGMAQLARNTWKRLQLHVEEAMNQYAEYSLVLTGHSLGGGVAALINILLYHENFMPDRKKECVAFAPPPAFYPLEAASMATTNTTVYIHNFDIVSSLSINSIRKAFKAIRLVDAYTKTLPMSEKFQLQMGKIDPPEWLVRLVSWSKDSDVRYRKGAPELMIPAETVVWLEQQDDGSYETLLMDPRKYSKRLLDLDPFMVDNHHLPKYDTALEQVKRRRDSLVLSVNSVFSGLRLDNQATINSVI